MSTNFQIVLLVMGSATCVVIGDGFTAAWAKSGSFTHAFLAGVFLALGCAGYFPAIRMGGLAWVADLGSVLAALGGVLVGVSLGETLSPQRWIGVIFAIIAISLLG